MTRNVSIATLAALTLFGASFNALAASNAKQQALAATYDAAAKTADAAFKSSVDRGKAFFTAKHTGGKPDSPSCTSCHTTDLTKVGKTRAGKDIEPMAASVAPARYTDPAQVDKWFKRNCSDVLGRECTAAEKADALAYLLSL